MDKRYEFATITMNTPMEIDLDLNKKLLRNLFETNNCSGNSRVIETTTQIMTQSESQSVQEIQPQTGVQASTVTKDPMDIIYDLNKLVIYFIFSIMKPDLTITDGTTYINNEINRLKWVIYHGVRFINGNS